MTIRWAFFTTLFLLEFRRLFWSGYWPGQIGLAEVVPRFGQFFVFVQLSTKTEIMVSISPVAAHGRGNIFLDLLLGPVHPYSAEMMTLPEEGFTLWELLDIQTPPRTRELPLWGTGFRERWKSMATVVGLMKSDLTPYLADPAVRPGIDARIRERRRAYLSWYSGKGPPPSEWPSGFRTGPSERS